MREILSWSQPIKISPFGRDDKLWLRHHTAVEESLHLRASLMFGQGIVLRPRSADAAIAISLVSLVSGVRAQAQKAPSFLYSNIMPMNRLRRTKGKSIVILG
jgi:hypothetical protein